MDTTTFKETLTIVNCSGCGVPFAMPDILRQKFRQSHDTFYCPSGHANYYPGKSDADILRERENQIVQLQTAKIQLETQLQKVAAGKCPCCGKTIRNLQKHMESMHPQQLKK